jgi:hypothetical protein
LECKINGTFSILIVSALLVTAKVAGLHQLLTFVLKKLGYFPINDPLFNKASEKRNEPE